MPLPPLLGALFPVQPLPVVGHLGLVVVLHGHGDDIEADDEGDEEVQVVAGAQRMDGAARV